MIYYCYNKKRIRRRIEKERLKKEEEEKREKEEIKLLEEIELERKLNKWVLEEEKGQELRKLLNQHPEDFQNVDEYFFTNRLGNLYKQLAMKKAARKERKRIERIKGHIRKKNKPYIMKLM